MDCCCHRRRRRGERACGVSMTSTSLWIGAMARALLVALSAHLLVAATSGMPPRLAACREVVKAKDATEVYPVAQSYSCQNVSFPCGSTPVLYADTRNCENYYRCTLMTLEQCPCPVGTTFNVQTQACDGTASACDCTQATASTAAVATPAAPVPASRTLPPTAAATRPPGPGGSATPASLLSSSTAAPAIVKDVVEVVAAEGGEGGTTAQHGASSNGGGGSSNGVDATVVVPAIVCSFLLLVAVVGVLAFLHVRGYLGHRKPLKPSQPPGVPCAPLAGTSDRHVYAEIDESKLQVGGQILWSQQHMIGSVPPPPPPPTTLPPPPVGLQQHFYPPYPPAVQQHGTLRGLHFNVAGSAKRAFPLTNPHMRNYDRSQQQMQAAQPPPATAHHHHRLQPHWLDCSSSSMQAPTPTVGGGFDGTSECSQCSACSSNQASLDASDSDMHTPLNAVTSPGHRAKAPAYVSKQVYI